MESRMDHEHSGVRRHWMLDFMRGKYRHYLKIKLFDSVFLNHLLDLALRKVRTTSRAMSKFELFGTIKSASFLNGAMYFS